MNILLLYLQSQTNLKAIDITNDVDFKNERKLVLQVPQVFNNVEADGQEMILLTPKNNKCDGVIQELIKVLDHLHHNNVKVQYDTQKYIIDFYWDKRIIFNSLNEMSNSLNSIPFSIKITSV